jgi:integrase
MTKKTRRGNNEGTVRLRNDDLWEARISLPGGGRKSVYGKSRAEVRRKMTEIRRRLERGENVAAKTELMAAFLNRWLLETAKLSVRESTYHAYASWVRNHLSLPRDEGGIGDIVLDKLTAEDVQRMLAARRKSGLSATSVDHVRRVLRIALNQAIKWGLISRNAAAMAKPPKRERHEIEPLSVTEVRVLLAETRDHRLHGLFVLAIHTGMRQGELLALRWRDIDLEKRFVRVRATLGWKDGKPAFLPPKSEQSRRTLALSSGAVAALVEQQERQQEQRLLAGDRWKERDLVFASTIGTPLNASNVTHEFQKALASAGLRRVRFHDLRHSAASFLIESGVDMRQVQDQLGHSGLAYTIGIYAHVSTTMKKRAADAMDALNLTVGMDQPMDGQGGSESASSQTGVETGVKEAERVRESPDADQKAA